MNGDYVEAIHTIWTQSKFKKSPKFAFESYKTKECILVRTVNNIHRISIERSFFRENIARIAATTRDWI